MNNDLGNDKDDDDDRDENDGNNRTRDAQQQSPRSRAEWRRELAQQQVSHKNLPESDLEPDSSNMKTTSTSDVYDIEEPLTTKVTKRFHKRPDKPVSPSDETDDTVSSYEQSQNATAAAYTNLDATSVFSDMPLSQHTAPHGTPATSSLLSSTSHLSSAVASDPFMTATLPGRSLRDGLVFIYVVLPPDGGYAWVIMLLSFLAQLIVDGIIFSIGILLPAIGEELGVQSAEVILIASIQIGSYFSGGAFASALINSLGFRIVACLGVSLSVIALLISSFSPNLFVMILTYSVIGGISLSMIWVSSQLIIGYYFERYRPIANGFSCSGAGAGLVIFSIMNSYLLASIGWRNAIRVEVLLLALVFFIGLSYAEVAPQPVGVVVDVGSLVYSSSDEYYGNFYVHNFIREDSPVGSKRSYVLEQYDPIKQQGMLRRYCQRCCPCCVRKKPDDLDEEDMRFVIRADPIQRETLYYTGPVQYEGTEHVEDIEGKQLELIGSEEQIKKTNYALSHIKDYDASEHKMHTHARRSSLRVSAPKKRHLCIKIVRALGRLFDYHLLEIFEFRVLVASAVFFPMGFNIPFVYSRARAEIAPEYAMCIGPTIGLMSLTVRILCGFLAFKRREWTNTICGGGIIIGGLSVLISAFYGQNLIWFQFVYGLIYGIAPAVYSTLRAIIYVRYLGLSKLTNAFGITALAMGMGVFIGTTLGGLLLDVTGDYTAAFAFSGVCIILSGCLKLLLPLLVRYRDRKKT